MQGTNLPETPYIARMNIVITGASRGLGATIAEKFAGDQQAHTFFLCARNEEKLQSFAKELKARFSNVEVYHFATDLAKKEGALAFVHWVLGFNKPVDLLMNNAGQYFPGSVHNEQDGALEQMMGINLYSAYHVSRGLLPHMIERKKGHIFNVCSIASLHAYANGGAYSISKFALLGFSKNLREEMKPYGIKVTAIIPGAIYTDSWKGSGVDPERLMQPDDLAAMVYTTAHLSPQACVEDIVMRPQGGDI